MKHMNPKKVKLLHEGFSINTLEKMSNQQINILYEKVKSKEMKEQPAPKVTNKTVKQIELPVGSKTTVSGNYSVANDAGKTVLTQTEGEMTEKALSKKQQQFFGIVRGMQKGDIPKKGKAGKAAKDMKKSDVLDFAKTKHKGLPKKKETKESQVKKIEENIMNLIEKHIYNEVSKKDILKLLNKR